MNNFQSYNFALAILVICVVSYYCGTLGRRCVPDTAVGQQAVDAVRFVAMPLVLVTTVVLAMMLFTARQNFNDRQALVDDIASTSLQLDRLLTYFGAPASKAKADFREYTEYLMNTPDAIWRLKRRADIEDFAREIQNLPVPKGDTGAAASTKRAMLELMSKISIDRFRLGTMTAKIIYPFTYTLLAVWLCVVFSVMGMTAPLFNAWVFWFSVVAASCVGSVCLIIAEYQNSTAGLIQLSLDPFKIVLQLMRES